MFRDEYFIHHGAYRTILSTAEQIEEILIDAGIIPYTPARDKFEGELGHPELNQNANDVNLIRALVLAGTHPNIAVSKGGVTFRSAGEPNAMVHPSSLNHAAIHPRGRDRNMVRSSDLRDTLWAFTSLQRSNDGATMFMHDSTQITPLIAMVLGGRLTAEHNLITMDGWLPFKVKTEGQGSYSEAANLIMEFRRMFDRVSRTISLFKAGVGIQH